MATSPCLRRCPHATIHACTDTKHSGPPSTIQNFSGISDAHHHWIVPLVHINSHLVFYVLLSLTGDGQHHWKRTHNEKVCSAKTLRRALCSNLASIRAFCSSLRRRKSCEEELVGSLAAACKLNRSLSLPIWHACSCAAGSPEHVNWESLFGHFQNEWRRSACDDDWLAAVNLADASFHN